MAASTVLQLLTLSQPDLTQVGAGLFDTTTILQMVQLSASGVSGLTAHAGGGAALATPCTAYINEFTTVATTNDSCILPPALAGLEITIINSGAAGLRVFPNQNNPATGVADGIVVLAGLTPSGSVNIPSAGFTVLSCTTVGRWKSQNQ